MAVACIALGCGPSASKDKPGAGSGTGSPADDGKLKLVVVLVIDQLPSWTFTRDASQLEGGLGRLLAESVYFPETTLPFSNTYTAPGHAMIATGTGPNKNGILANGWPRQRGNAYVPATADSDHPVFDFSVKNVVERAEYGASSQAMRLEGVADVLTRERPNAKSVSLGLKQRAAILMLGKRPTRAVWYESKQLALTTGTFYGEAPKWLVDFNASNPVSELFKRQWTVADGPFLRKYTGVGDDGAGEGAGIGLTTSFPHSVAGLEAAPKAVRLMPVSVDYLLSAAKAAIAGEKLGQRGEIDLLGVTISSHDYVGHFWGQESWERFDMLRQIDRALDDFFKHLDSVVGPRGYSVLLTSDHGAVPLVEQSRKAGREARRIALSELTAAADKGFVKVLGKGHWLAGYGASSIYVSDDFRKQPAEQRSKALASAIAELRAIPNVELVELTANLTGDCAAEKDELRRSMCESIHPEESGEIMLVPDRYSLFQADGYTTGTSHGTPSLECRQVPVLVRMPGVPRLQSTSPASGYQIAPTISTMLGISSPEGALEVRPLPLEADTADVH